jgi:hypothetical protein
MASDTHGSDFPSGPLLARRWWPRLVVSGGLLSALNGVAHFVLPVYFPWGEHVADLYAPVSWALYATTVFFGILLTLGGLLVVTVARMPELPSPLVTWIVAGLAGFWIFGAGYEVVIPFPAPVASWALPAFSVTVAALLLGGLWLRRKSAQPAHRPAAPTTTRA